MTTLALTGALACAEPPKHAEWELVFSDDFSGTEEELDQKWEFQNGPSGHIICSRWRDNAVLQDGLLHLTARKETRAGQDWTAASCWTRQTFQYGYFECRYRYLPATGTNNSFWIMVRGKTEPRFEIDINEGHYPDEVNMNLHNHSGKHWAVGGRWYPNERSRTSGEDSAGFSFELGKPVRTRQIRITSEDPVLRIVEFRLFPPNETGYPTVFPASLVAQPDVPNIASKAVLAASSCLGPDYAIEHATDGRISNDARWVSRNTGEKHELVLSFDQDVEIGCIQFISGWKDGDEWKGVVQDFQIDSWNGTTWEPVPNANGKSIADSYDLEEEGFVNLGKSFHTYGLEWTEDSLVYYFDGVPIRTQEHDICRRAAPVFLSLAIMKWAGRVTDAIDGQSMDVDYVKVYRRK